VLSEESITISQKAEENLTQQLKVTSSNQKIESLYNFSHHKLQSGWP
jgi:hypothetical protein